ncbi:hypothetical protein ACOMHN_050711 [Nucella lapillus]
MGVIEPSVSPYASPIVLVKKRDGKIRFCVDYRKLNKAVVFDVEPMPSIDYIYAKMGEAQVIGRFQSDLRIAPKRPSKRLRESTNGKSCHLDSAPLAQFSRE